MSGAINLTPYTVTATGTVTNNSTRIAGFTIINKSATNMVGARFYNLSDDGSVNSKIINIDFLGSVETNGGANQITQTYSGNTGIYFKNGVYCSVDTSCRLYMTAF
jgi:hypothetical protein